jgi:hypothetical protein
MKCGGPNNDVCSEFRSFKRRFAKAMRFIDRPRLDQTAVDFLVHGPNQLIVERPQRFANWAAAAV